MAKCYTTSEDLTSIANAIRAKTGNESSLIYPNGFVSAINNIIVGQQYNWIGENPTIVWQSEWLDHTLSETNLSNWTPSGTYAIIYNEAICNPSTLYLDGTKYYVAVYDGYYNIVYTGEPTIGYVTEGYYTGFYHIGRIPQYQSNFIAGTQTYATYSISGSFNTALYQSQWGALTTHGGYGFYFGLAGPALSNQSSANFGCDLKTPTLRAIASDGTMRASNYALIDQNNSDFHMRVTLYQVSEDIMRQTLIYQKDLYDLNHSNT